MIIFVLMSIVFFSVGIIAFFNADSVIEVVVAAAASAVPFLIILIVISKKKSPLDKKYKESFEKSVVNKALESVLDVKEFEREKGFEEKIIIESKIFPYYENYMGEDYLSAEYHGTHFLQADVKMTKEVEEYYKDSKGNRRVRMVTVNAFTGRLIVVHYDAISNEPVFVHDRRIQSIETIVETELQSFNDRFSIEAESPQSAFRILTPQVLEGIVNASDKLNCPISMAFMNDKIYIALASGDSFVITNMRGETLLQQQERIRGDVQIILDLIDSIYLKQNGEVHV
jgi:hypothetical protein